MKLEQNEIEKIAYLAKLTIADGEMDGYQKDLNQIIDLVSQMQEIDTNGIEPLAHPHEVNQLLRADEITQNNERDKLQAIAPNIENGLFIVPRVIE